MKCLIVASVVVAFMSKTATASYADCYRNTNCKSCAGASQCGWDAGMSKCKTGTVYGPNIGYASKWDWSVDQCKAGTTNNCGTHTDCSSCTTSGGSCGWDARVMKCLLGNSTGPSNGVPNAKGNEWSWGVYNCPPSADCSQYKNCDTCTLAPTGTCGWNTVSEACTAGTANGPRGSTASSLPAGAWKFTVGTCPSMNNQTDRCGALTNCYNCTRSVSATCGWTGTRCLVGTPSGPTDPRHSSSFWGWTSDLCAQSTSTEVACAATLGSCSKVTNCLECVDSTVNSGECAWDKYRSKCQFSDGLYGGTGVVQNGYPDNCYSQTVDCNEHASCSGCTTDTSGICGWDAGALKCRQGTATGPVSGQTRYWVWKTMSCPIIKQCSQYLTLTSCNNYGEFHTFDSGNSFSYCAWTLTNSVWGCQPSETSVTGAVSNGDVVTECWTQVTCTTCADLAHCGWDNNAKLCKEGNALGPNKGDLPKAWDFTADQCNLEQCGGTCQSSVACGACAGNTNCGWDTNSNTCRPGTLNGPARPTKNEAINEYVDYDVGNWQYGVAGCDWTTCSMYSGCYDCTDNAGCGWSGQDGGICARGNAAGPFVSNGETGWKHTQSSCGFTWSWRWNANSGSMWLTIGMIILCSTCSCVFVHRRNRKLRLLRANAAGNFPLINQPRPTTAALAGAGAATTGTVYGATSNVATGAPGGAPVYPYGNAAYAATPSIQDAAPAQPTMDSSKDCSNSMPVMEDIA